ncbi:hypothetical protein Vretifemale_18037, partial [Volvox reticuliferus]
MSDSEDDRLPNLPSAPRQKRFRFKTFAERVSEVDVDVYKQLGAVKTEPSAGSWLAEGLTHWRELNSAAHFLQVAMELQPLCQTLPLLLHHQKDVARILLGSLEPAARLSLPALLDLLSRFARDLQQQFLPLLPKVVRRIVQLLNGGAEREPESLEAIFTCVSYICKYLVRHLAADLPSALRVTAPLRYYHADYVRQFAAQAAGYLLRSAPSAAALRSGVRAVLAEQAVRPTPERTDGAGLVLAEAVLGVSHGLHSRAQQVLQLLLKEDLLQPSDLRHAPASSSKEAKTAAMETETGADGTAVMVSQERLRARAVAVARVALARLLDHLRPGKGGEFWKALLTETHTRLQSFEIVAAAAGPSADIDAAARSLARMLVLVSEAVGYFRGSRVESYKPLMELLGRLMQPAVWLPSTRAAAAAGSDCDGSGGSGSSPGNSSPDISPIASPRPVPAAALPALGFDDGDDDDGDLYDVSLSYAVLDLVRCVVYGNLKAVGASDGPEALVGCAASWSPCFSRPPAAEALLFVKSLMVPPASIEITRIFSAQMMGCLGRFIIQKQQPSQQQLGAKQQQQQHDDEDAAGSALLLLRDLCDLLQPPQQYREANNAVVRPTGLPLLLTAQPHGVRLAAHVRAMATNWRPEAVTDPRVSAEVWAAVSLLPHACESDFQAVTICEQVLEAASEALRNRLSAAPQTKRQKRVYGDGDAIEGATVGCRAAASDAEGGFLLIRATATELLAELLQRQQQSGLSVSLVTVAEASVQWVLDRLDERPSRDGGGLGADYASLRAAGSLLSAVRRSISGGGGCAAAGMGSGAIIEMARELLSESRLKEMVGRLAPLLAHESQSLRAAVLRLLCCFDQPALEALGPDPKDPTATIKKQHKKKQHGSNSTAAAVSTGPRCDLLEVLYGINSQPFTIESGRKWAVAMGRLKTYLEYTRIPEFLVPAFAYGMVGVLYIRFSPLWQPASEALAACIQFQAQASWPIVFSFLKTSQRELLSGNFPAAAGGGGGGGG